MDSHMLQSALGYARRGWRVFPLHGIVNGRCTCGRRDCSSAGKHPLVRHGLKEAATEAARIHEWWRRWPLANIGLASGKTSGIVVIDIDLPRALPSLDQLVHKLPSTLTGCTGGGGLHLIYRGNCADLRCTTSQVPGIGPLIGVDVRADGGYIVAPPSTHRSGTRYTWLDPNVEIADAPGWLKQPERRPIPPVPPAPRLSAGAGTAYGLAVLRNQLEILRMAQVGERNHTLNRCAFTVARFVAGGHLTDAHARDELHRVGLQIGLTDWETTRTITSAFGSVYLRYRT